MIYLTATSVKCKTFFTDDTKLYHSVHVKIQDLDKLMSNEWLIGFNEIVGWFYNMSTLVGLFYGKVSLKANLQLYTVQKSILTIILNFIFTLSMF